MDISSCYRLLGVTPDSSQKQLRTAYRNLAMILHPDKQTIIPPTYYYPEINFVKVQQAYEKITQQRKRLSRISLTAHIFKESFSNLFGDSSGDQGEDVAFKQQNKRMQDKLASIRSTLDRWGNKEMNQNVKQKGANKFETQQNQSETKQRVTIVRGVRFQSITIHADQINNRIRNKINIFTVVRQDSI